MKVVIDSSHKLLFTGVLSGHTQDMDEFCDKFQNICKENGISHRYHWNELARKKRDLLKKPMLAALQEARGIRLNIIQHRKPANVDRKGWYLYHVPAMIAQRMESWLRNKNGELEILVDNDYNVMRGGFGTGHFIETLARQIAIRLTGRETTVRKNGHFRAEIKQPNGGNLLIFASVAQKDSKWVGLVDAYLGLYVYDGTILNGLDNVYYTRNKK